MKKVLHIIPGWEETCRRKPYKKIAEMAQKKGYKIKFHNIDWKIPLSKQIFPVSEEDTVFGFSLGAILAWLVAQNYSYKHIILASMTPYYSFKDKKIKKALIEITGSKFIEDINKNLETKHRAKKQTIIYGDKEDEKADILVPNTEHELTDEYIKILSKLLK